MNLGSLLGFARPLGHLVWWTGPDLLRNQLTDAAEVRARWARARLPAVTQGLPAALEETMRALLAIPLLEKSGVWWLAPDFDGHVQNLREALQHNKEWELHTTPIRATGDTLAALRASAQRFVEHELGTLSTELEALVTQPRQRASLLVRRLDALEVLRRHAGLHALHLELDHPGLAQHLDGWAARIDAALCARIVA